jgi:hypothetical protein
MNNILFINLKNEILNKFIEYEDNYNDILFNLETDLLEHNSFNIFNNIKINKLFSKYKILLNEYKNIKKIKKLYLKNFYKVIYCESNEDFVIQMKKYNEIILDIDILFDSLTI